MVYMHLAKYKKALEYYETSLTIRKENNMYDHHEAAITKNNLGQMQYQLGRFEEALKYHNEALKTNIKYFGKEHPVIANCYNNIGLVLSKRA
mmetsp:Transcript_4013/g.3424  ORF Transcript_4013/g.3424 Transcript_4013/m.3424 type:complete len:92 (+) Transcript_4013:507-782(+)